MAIKIFIQNVHTTYKDTLRRKFEIYDKNKDGYLEINELKEAIQNMSQIQKIHIDEENEKSWQLIEDESYPESQKHNVSLQVSTEKPTSFDKELDNNLLLSQQEIQEIINQITKDGKRQISYEQWLTACLSVE